MCCWLSRKIGDIEGRLELFAAVQTAKPCSQRDIVDGFQGRLAILKDVCSCVQQCRTPSGALQGHIGQGPSTDLVMCCWLSRLIGDIEARLELFAAVQSAKLFSQGDIVAGFQGRLAILKDVCSCVQQCRPPSRVLNVTSVKDQDLLMSCWFSRKIGDIEGRLQLCAAVQDAKRRTPRSHRSRPINGRDLVMCCWLSRLIGDIEGRLELFAAVQSAKPCSQGDIGQGPVTLVLFVKPQKQGRDLLMCCWLSRLIGDIEGRLELFAAVQDAKPHTPRLLRSRQHRCY
ncbi:hypothetical protein J6590_006185 [Homalodisca vitripennis]|nr:hypothetical protein J6590_006185 [Homalodisca vitripennis]